jgi:hypothetical protein
MTASRAGHLSLLSGNWKVMREAGNIQTCGLSRNLFRVGRNVSSAIGSTGPMELLTLYSGSQHDSVGLRDSWQMTGQG